MIIAPEEGFPWAKVNAAKRYLTVIKPWWGRFLDNFVIVPVEVMPDSEGVLPYGSTTATDRDFRIYVDRLFALSVPLHYLAGAIEHELQRHTRDSWQRFKFLKDEQWREEAVPALDLEINSTIDREQKHVTMDMVYGICGDSALFTTRDLENWNVTAPPGFDDDGWIPRVLGMEDGLSAEQYHQEIKKLMEEPPPPEEDDGDTSESDDDSEEEADSEDPEGQDEESDTSDEGSDDEDSEDEQEGESQEGESEEDEQEDADGAESDSDEEPSEDDTDGDGESDEDSDGDGEGSDEQSEDEGGEGGSSEGLNNKGSGSESGDQEGDGTDEGDESESGDPQESSGEGSESSNSSEPTDGSPTEDKGQPSESGSPAQMSDWDKAEAIRELQGSELGQMWQNSMENPTDPIDHPAWKPDDDTPDYELPDKPTQGEITAAFEALSEDIGEFSDEMEDISPAGFGDDLEGSLRVWRENYRKAKGLNWDRHFMKLANAMLSSTQIKGQSDLSYSVRNPHQAAIGPILQGLLSYSPTIYVLQDVSGSMHAGKMAKSTTVFTDLCKKVLANYGDKVTWFSADMSIRDVGKTSRWDEDVRLAWSFGFGGTQGFGEILDKLMRGKLVHKGKKYPKPDLVITSTDCCFPWAEVRPRSAAKLLIVNVGSETDADKWIPEWVNRRKEFVQVD